MSFFFKVILQRTIEAKKMMVPRSFVEKNEGVFSNFVMLKVPSGDEWRVELVKSDGGEVWLSKGWEQFADFYSLACPYWLLFEHVGSSCFCVSIFGKEGTEIDYPCERIHQKFSVPTKEEPLDDSDDILPPPAPNHRRREKPPVMHQRPSKRMKVERDSLLQSQGRGRKAAPHHGRPRGPVWMNSLTPADKAKAVARAARSFRPKDPFFMVVMQPSYIIARCGLPIPNFISAEYLESRDEIILKRSGTGGWSVAYNHTQICQGKTQVRLQGGWKEFVVDNDLKVADVCIFELMEEEEEVTFNVSISRSTRRRDDTQAGSFGYRSWKAPLLDALDKVTFQSQLPFFLVAMYRSYVTGRYRPLIPREFSREHLGGKKDATVQDGKIKVRVRLIKTYGEQMCFSCEWRDFVKAKSLNVGDVCAFELIKREKCVFRVTIFRRS